MTSRTAKNKDLFVGRVVPDSVLPTAIPKEISSGGSSSSVSYKDFFDPSTMEFDRSKIRQYKMAHLVFLGDKRKLSGINLEATDDKLGHIYGGTYEEYEDGRPVKKLKRFSVTEPVTPIDLTTDNGIELFECAMANVSVKGSLNMNIEFLRFKMVIPEIENQAEFDKMELETDLRVEIKGMDEQEMNDVGMLMGITNFKALGSVAKRTTLYKIAQENPKSLQPVVFDRKNSMALLFLKAKDAKVITQKMNIWQYGDHQMGPTEDLAIKFLEQNQAIAKLIEDNLKL